MLDGSVLICTQNREAIAQEATKAYDVLSEQRGIITRNMHARPYCNQFTRAVVPILREAAEDTDINIRTREWQPSSIKDFLRTSGLFFHKFVTLEMSGESLLVDGTWQQFLPRWKRNLELPRIIVGTRDELVEFAAESGVHSRFHRVWQNA